MHCIPVPALTAGHHSHRRVAMEDRWWTSDGRRMPTHRVHQLQPGGRLALSLADSGGALPKGTWAAAW